MSPLPPELLLQIVEEAAGHRGKVDYTILRHLCLTSRDFLRIARAALYRDVEVVIKETLDAETTREQVGQATYSVRPEAICIQTRGLLLAQTVTDSPHLASLIESASFNFQNTTSCATSIPADVLRSLLQGCKYLHRLQLCSGADALGVEVDALAQEISAASPSAVTHVGSIFTGRLLEAVSRLPALKHLELLRLHEDDEFDPPRPGYLPPLPFQLNSLRQEDPYLSIPLVFLSHVMKGSTSSLKHLSVNPETLVDLSSHLPDFEALERVDVEVGPRYIEEDERALVARSLNQCGRLRHLTLSGMVSDVLVPSFLSALPSTITTLAFHGGFLVMESLQLLLSRTARPQLRRVQLVDNDWEVLREKEEILELCGKEGWSVCFRGAKVVLVR